MDNITLKDALAKLNGRRDAHAEENQALYAGDHLRKVKNYAGYIGVLPEQADPAYSFTVAWLERIFAATNLIKSATNRNLNGCLGREPDWSLIFPATVTEARAEQLKEEVAGKNGSLIEWWNDYAVLQTVLREAGRVCLLEGEAYLRPIIPVSMRDERGRVQFKNTLSEALDLFDFEILSADKAGIFTDTATGQKFSVCRQEDKDIKQVEISWIGADGLTYLKILAEDDLKAWTENNFSQIAAYFLDWQSDPATMAEPLDLGGRLYLQKITREMLITEPARSLQRSVNYALTTMNKNLNVAGGRDTYATNAQRPKKRVETKDANGTITSVTETDDAIIKGASNVNFLAGFPLRDPATGKIVDYTQAGVTTVDPVAVDTFVKAFEVYRLLFLDEVHQSHILNNELAALSGKSKQESKSEFKASLTASKIPLDAGGRYIIGIGLMLAAAFTNRTQDFTGVRVDFNCQIQAGATDLEEIRQEALDVEEGRSSLYEYLVKKGSDDPDASLDRIRQSDGYDLAQLKNAVEVAILAAGAVTLKTAIELSAMTDAGKTAVIAALKQPEPPTEPPTDTADPNPAGAMVN
jgi:hypothetical protein